MREAAALMRSSTLRLMSFRIISLHVDESSCLCDFSRGMEEGREEGREGGREGGKKERARERASERAREREREGETACV